jgi:hypothetical protein
MADVYLAYSGADSAFAQRLALALRDAGLTVWFDDYLPGNADNDEIREREIESASIVVVLWSARSVKSALVQREVERAPKELVSVFIERVEPQIQGGMHLAVDLTEWTGSANDPQLQRLVGSIRTRLELDELDPLILLDLRRTPPAASVPAPTSIPPSDYDPFADVVPDQDLDTSNPTEDTVLPERTVTPRRTSTPPPPPASAPSPIPEGYPRLQERETAQESLRRDAAEKHRVELDATKKHLDAQKATKEAVPPQRTMVAVNCPRVIGTSWQTIRAYLFPKIAEAEVVDDASRLRDSAEAQHTSAQANVSQIKLGTLIAVTVDLPDIECQPQQRRFIWRGRWHKVDFAVRSMGQRGSREGNISWFAGIVCIAQLPLSVQLTDECENRTSSVTVTAPGYESVFVSYSTEDSVVVDWLETTYTALGMSYLRDVKTLRSGEAWDEKLLKLIERADLFQLCWSENAKQSQYVADEWRFALGVHKPNFIRPCYWEHPMPEPPPELQRLHFARLKLNWMTRAWFRIRARFG